MGNFLKILFCILVSISLFGQDIYTENLKKLYSQPQGKHRDSLIVNNLFAQSRIVQENLELWIDSLRSFSVRNKNERGLLLWEVMDAEKAIRKLNFEDGIRKHLSFAKKLEDSGNRRFATWNYLRAGIILARPSTPFIRKKDALSFYNKGLEIAKSEKDTSEIIRAYVYIGEYYLDIKNLNEALKYLKLAENHLETFGDKNLYPTTLASLGSCYLLKNNVPKANLYFQKMDYWLDHNPFKFKAFYRSYISNIKFLGYANYYFDRKDYKNAALHAQHGYDAVQGFKAANNTRSYNTYAVDHLNILCQSHSKSGNFKPAFDYLQEYQSILNQNSENELNESFQELNTKYQTEQKELQIKTLENEKITHELKSQQRFKVFLFSIIASLVAFLLFGLWSWRALKIKNKEISAALLLGQTSERKRVASDLHDNLGSTLSSLRWSVGAIDKNKLSESEQEVYQHLQNSLDQAYHQVRLLSHNLLPESLEKQGLFKTIEQQLTKLNRTTPVNFTLKTPNASPELQPKTAFELYSIYQELINNILRHSNATTASVFFENQTNKQLRMTISDNGRGSNPSLKGQGLTNIAERVKNLNGTLEFENHSGFTVIVNVPI